MSSTSPASSETPSLKIRSYIPPRPNDSFPYTPSDLTPMDSSSDQAFYDTPRFVTHIDDNAISSLRTYYSENFPKKGRILDLCSSWISHFPREHELAVQRGELEALGVGMNEEELKKNPMLIGRWWVWDLNKSPEIHLPEKLGSAEDGRSLDAATCVVSVDYLTRPVEVLSSLRNHMRHGGMVHLVISNRCFPTKAVGRWLKVSEKKRLEMVGDYLWWSGWKDIEIVTVVEGSWMKDPLWVVRGMNDG
ncbi:MAG: hypothetical protein Q9227_003445 [Pyrenula ochraceoflavens]